MFLEIANTPRDYAWGSTSAIAELLGTTPSGGPEAELWLGAHPGSPSRILDPSASGGAADLAAWVAAAPGRSLPFLLKVLAAASPLSLQVHPTTAQAIEGFAREDAAGIPRDAAHRNYKDASHKPELVVAVSERYSALSGFREPAATVRILDALLALAREAERAPLTQLRDTLATGPDAASVSAGLRAAVEWLLGDPEGSAPLVAAVTRIAEQAATRPAPEGAGAPASGGEPAAAADALLVSDALATARLLAAEYPGDSGIVLSLLLNTVHLRRGEALYLPAGNIHAYLEGLGIELMAASDNVLRGGLTVKHIDVPELLSVLQAEPVTAPYLVPEVPAPGIRVFRPGVPEFQLVEVTAEQSAPAVREWSVPGPVIALCTAGEWLLEGASAAASRLTIARGQSVFGVGEEGPLRLVGHGTLWLATTDPSAG